MLDVRRAKYAVPGLLVMTKDDKDYRSHLVLADQKAQDDYDKTVVALSGGALGVSFAFIKDVVGTQPIVHSWYLFVAWIAWALSLSCALGSYFASILALRRAIDQVDENRIHRETPGGWYYRLTSLLNALGGLLFVVGVVLITVFVGYNLR